MRSELTVKAGPAGWVGAIDSAAGDVYVRFVRKGKRGGWQAAGLYLHAPTPARARLTPLRRIELAVNASEVLSRTLAERLEEPSPQPGTAEFFAAFAGYGHVPEPIKLKRPKTHRLDDSWYAEVAAAYRQALERGENPRAAIAAAAGVSSDVAGRWIYEARNRKLIAKTQPGKVTP